MLRNPAFRPSSSWPTADSLLLLQAAAFEPVRAKAALDSWLARHDLTQADDTSLRLLPAVDFNLRQGGVKHAHEALLAGLRRHTLCRAHWLLQSGAELVRALEAQRIPSLVLKGAALAKLYAPSLSVRPMNDLDLLVPRRRALDAMTILSACGFRPHARRPAELIAIRHSTPFSRGPIELDLHWGVLPESHGLDDAWAFEDSRALDLGGVMTRALSPAAQLFHVIAHGSRYVDTPAAWWPLDALFVLRATPDLDFDRLSTLAQAHGLTHSLLQGLSLLARQLELDIPNHTLSRLAEAPRGLLRRLEDVLRTYRLEPLGELPLHLLHYHRLSASLPLSKRMLGLPEYLNQAWQLEPTASLGAAISQKAKQRLSAWLAPHTLAMKQHGPADDTRHR